MSVTRWGILGTGCISNDYATAIKSLRQTNIEIAAVAARQMEKAKEFAAKFGIKRYYGSYEELINDSDIDIVYIGTIALSHAALAKMAINAGKAVLCETPMAMNSRESMSVINLAREKKVFFMEGYWTNFFPAIHRLRDILKEKMIGDPKILTLTLGFDWFREEVVRLKELGGGCIHLNGYCVLMSRIVFPDAKLERVVASGTLTDSGIDSFVSTTLYYDKGRMAQLVVSTVYDLENTAAIASTDNKMIQVLNFWSPCEIITPSGRESFPSPTTVFDVIHPRSEGLQYEVQAVCESLQKGELENPIATHAESLFIMKVMDDIRKHIGVRYDADDEFDG